MDLKHCADKGCNPIEQVRGQMGDEDYFDVLENDTMEAFLRRVPRPYHQNVEIDDNNKNDVRIICRKCHRTTGWNRADAPGMPGAGVAWLRLKWDEMVSQEGRAWR